MSPPTLVPSSALLVESPGRQVLDELGSKASSQAGSENFPVALRLLPRGARSHLLRLYEYARFVDDVGDEAAGDRVELLDLVEADVKALWAGQPSLAAVAGMQATITQFAIPPQPLLDLIEANRLDQTKTSYPTYAELISYCRLSADPIGRIVLYIAGAVTVENLRDSDSVCSALQVLEHCQDVGEDFARGRVYLPSEDLARAGVAATDLGASTTSAQLCEVIAQQVARAEIGLQAGRGLVARLPGWARFAVGGFVAGGLATVDALRAADFDVLARSVRPSKARLAVHTAGLVVGRG